MDKVRALLTPGTDKMGRSLYGWSLPAVQSCPGRSSTCERVCYATKGRFSIRDLRDRQRWCWRQSQRKDFADRMVEELFRRGVLVCRIHVAGDFYAPRYVRKWIDIVGRSAHCRFFAYTRSWRIPTLEPLLVTLSARDNVRLWYSADRETGYPPRVPPGVRVAWLQTSERESVVGDLVFQVRRLRPLALPLAVAPCEHETPEGQRRGVTCSTCQLCFR